MSANPLKVGLEKDGSLLRLRLSRPKANIVDAAMIAALRSALGEHLPDARLKAVLLDAEGPHFSFGASVEEHLPESCARASAQALRSTCLNRAPECCATCMP
ncbi:MAG: bamR [Actinobacteria bacterium]|nr:bamR [Actinomycetota bacterium]